MRNGHKETASFNKTCMPKSPGECSWTHTGIENYSRQFLSWPNKKKHPLSAHDNLRSSWTTCQVNTCQPAIACRVSAVHHAAGHVLAMTRIALHHHGSGLEDRHGDLCHGQLLMVRLLRRNHWGVGCEHEVNSWAGRQSFVDSNLAAEHA